MKITYFDSIEVFPSLQIMTVKKDELADEDTIRISKFSSPDYERFLNRFFLIVNKTEEYSIQWRLKHIYYWHKDAQIEIDKKLFKEIKGFGFIRKSLSLQRRDIRMDTIKIDEIFFDVADTPEIRTQIKEKLREYLIRFVTDQPKENSKQKELIFSIHLDILNTYINNTLGVINDKHHVVSSQDFINILLEKHPGLKGTKYEYKFMETIATLWLAEIISIHQLWFEGKEENTVYFANIEFRKRIVVDSNHIREALGMLQKNTMGMFKLRKRSYEYNGKIFGVEYRNGDTDGIDFRGTKQWTPVQAEKTFRMFLELWNEDSSGEYPIERVQSKYKEMYKEERWHHEFINDRRNIVEKMKHGPRLFTEKMDFWGNRRKGKWVFKINDDV